MSLKDRKRANEYQPGDMLIKGSTQHSTYHVPNVNLFRSPFVIPASAGSGQDFASGRFLRSREDRFWIREGDVHQSVQESVQSVQVRRLYLATKFARNVLVDNVDIVSICMALNALPQTYLLANPGPARSDDRRA